VPRVKLSRVTAVVLLALLGLVLAAAVTYAASTIVSHPIGLAAEPTDIGESLGPPQVTRPTTVQTTVTRTTTVQAPAPPPKTTTQPAQTTFAPATTPGTTTPSTHDDDHGHPDSDD